MENYLQLGVEPPPKHCAAPFFLVVGGGGGGRIKLNNGLCSQHLHVNSVLSITSHQNLYTFEIFFVFTQIPEHYLIP